MDKVCSKTMSEKLLIKLNSTWKLDQKVNRRKTDEIVVDSNINH